ncbi:enoyl-CoA hydratase/isomerase family protein [Cognatishimia sp. WU-CL00825]|uniref:enoyl-CoA hydratase/isomerase family protein n=1 Tax=Cognatishimia sp. WU-CL00825 TaxID=3127658 RepID=UPI003103F78D
MSAVHLKITGPIAVLTLDNAPKLNALTPDMLCALESHCDALDQNADVRVILLTADHPKAFCVGADITAWADLPAAQFARSWVRGGHRIFDRLARLCKPTIAVLNGHAFGGGLELAAACDLRVMAPNARIALPEASVGIVPGWSGTQRLHRLLPEPVLKEMVLFGRQLGADRAQQLGFVAEVSEDPMAVALTIAESTAQLSPRATEISKYMIHAGAGEDSAALIETMGGGLIADTDDKAEGVAAFVAKRKPDFSGQS